MRSMIIGLLLKFVQEIGLLLFEYFKGKYGEGLMDWSLELIGMREKEILDGKIQPLGALVANAREIQEKTRNSPGIPLTECIMINQAAYTKYVKDTQPDKYSWWNWDKKKAVKYCYNKPAKDFMNLYKPRK